MNYSTDDIDGLFRGWRKSRIDSSFEAVLGCARSMSDLRKIDDAQVAAVNTDVIETLYRCARDLPNGVPESSASDDAQLKQDIRAYAINHIAHLKHQQSTEVKVGIFQRIKILLADSVTWVSTWGSPGGFVTASLLLVATGGVVYYDNWKSEPYQLQLTSMEIATEVTGQSVSYPRMTALGFNQTRSLEESRFNLGRAFSIIYQQGRPNDQTLVSILSPLEMVLPTSGEGLQLADLAEELKVSRERQKAVIDTYLEDSMVYLGYWVQNMYFSLETRSDRNIDILLNHVELKPALKQTLNTVQFESFLESLDVNANHGELENLVNKLVIWLGS